MSRNARAIGMDTDSLPRPIIAARIHSAIKTDDATEAISHAARARSLTTAPDWSRTCLCSGQLTSAAFLSLARLFFTDSPQPESEMACQLTGGSCALLVHCRAARTLAPHDRRPAKQGSGK